MPESTYARVLAYLAKAAPDAYSIPEIAVDLKLSDGTVRLAIKDLVEAGRAIKLGTSSTNARCYAITATGREAIAVAELRRESGRS